MIDLIKSPRTGPLDAALRKFKSLGLDSDEEVRPLVNVLRIEPSVRQGQDILRPGRSPKHLAVLLAGIACLYQRLEDGSRHIYTFLYPGDFCDLSRYVLIEMGGAVAVGALTDCSIGSIRFEDLERTMARQPRVGMALWRATMLEASIFRENLLNVSRRPALARVAHLLCEQLARRELVGLRGTVVPLTQIDLADAAGLSAVHVNRTLQDLRRLGILSGRSRSIDVVERDRLAKIAKFSGHYLNMPKLLSKWAVSIEAPTR
jgi:CRP-like cAMP-binding protein